MIPGGCRKDRWARLVKASSAAVVLLILVFPADEVSGAARSPRDKGEADPRTFVPTGPLESKHIFKNYVINTYREEGGGQGSLEVLRNGRRIYARRSREESGQFLVGELHETNTPKERVSLGKDITGRGVPNMVISEWTGGAHCCYFVYAFEIGKRFRRLATLDAGDGPLDFEDLDRDGILEFLMRDWTFAYWKTCFACSPAPRVILRFRSAAYRMAPNLMRRPPPTPAELATRAKELWESGKWKEELPSPDVWSVMLDLIYTGNARQAWEFIEMAWRPGVPGKEDFLKDFQVQLAKSRFWPDIKAMNRGR
ncbi:MAG: hypothetical protein HY803_09310 [candidate division NC10 bacterium]|nr:hypothetical protein [candidate division NC10 bacterium]